MKILIIGPSGAGKTHLSKEFRKMGLNAFDADELEGLHGWYNWQKKRVRFPHDAGKEFLDNHEFLWDRKFLENFLAQNPDVYLFGNSGNASKMADLFDKIYFLKTPKEILLERLDHQSRTNPMGKTEAQKQAVIEWAEKNEKDARRLNAEFLDGTLSAEEILKLIK